MGNEQTIDYIHLVKENSSICHFLNTLTEEVFIYDSDARLQFLNHAAEICEGMRLNDVQGKSIFELYDFEYDLTEFTSPTLTALREKRDVTNKLVSYYINGQSRTKMMSASVIMENDNVKGVFFAQHDVMKIAQIIDQNIELQYLIGQQKSFVNRHKETAFDSIIGESELFQQSIMLAKKAARTDSPVMIIGDEGSGKKMLAKAIHEESNRADMPFLQLNCSSIPEVLFERIFLGVHKEHPLDTQNHDSILVQGDGGTVFLDEINYMPLSFQPRFLQILEEKKIKGEDGKEIPIDVRFICSSTETLKDNLISKHIRSDLFYSLAIIPIEIPSLKQRKRDISLLTDYFIAQNNKRYLKKVSGVSSEVASLLTHYHWPGNVRQLKSCIESAMNLTEDNRVISAESLPAYILHSGTFWNESEDLEAEPRKMFEYRKEHEDKEREETLKAFKKFNGNITQAANALGISRQLLYYRLKKYNLK